MCACIGVSASEMCSHMSVCVCVWVNRVHDIHALSNVCANTIAHRAIEMAYNMSKAADHSSINSCLKSLNSPFQQAIHLTDHIKYDNVSISGQLL